MFTPANIGEIVTAFRLDALSFALLAAAGCGRFARELRRRGIELGRARDTVAIVAVLAVLAIAAAEWYGAHAAPTRLAAGSAVASTSAVAVVVIHRFLVFLAAATVSALLLRQALVIADLRTSAQTTPSPTLTNLASMTHLTLRTTATPSISAPVAATPPPVTAAPPERETSTPTRSGTKLIDGRNRHVLVVDDVAANRVVLQMFLEQQGFTSEQAESGEEAVQMARHTRYDAILMDLQMPGVDGYTAARRIRAAQGPSEHALILAVTACIGDDVRSKCLAAGMDGHFSKPLDLRKFCRTLDELISTRSTAGLTVAAERAVALNRPSAGQLTQIAG